MLNTKYTTERGIPANTKRNKRVIIASKRHFDVFITLCASICICDNGMSARKTFGKLSKFNEKCCWNLIMQDETTLMLNEKKIHVDIIDKPSNPRV